MKYSEKIGGQTPLVSSANTAQRELKENKERKRKREKEKKRKREKEKKRKRCFRAKPESAPTRHRRPVARAARPVSLQSALP
jgi:hypothetical protein